MVAISADATASHIRAVRAAGALDYLTKPLDIDQFLRAVESAFGDGEEEA